MKSRRCRFLSTSVRVEQTIQKAAQKKNVHTGIEPDHKQGNRGHCSVEGRIVADVVNIIGIQVGEAEPAGGGQKRSRQLFGKVQLFVGNMGIENVKEKKHNDKADNCTETDNRQQDIFEKGKCCCR